MCDPISCTSCSTGASCSRAASSWWSASSARATTRSAASSAQARPVRSPVRAVAEADVAGGGERARASEANAAAETDGVRVKPGRHREATLYKALAKAGARDGRTLEQLRADARRAYDALELPVWRRSGFWTTNLQSLDLGALHSGPPPAPGEVPAVVSRTLPDRPRAGRIVQSGSGVVHVELDAAARERGVILCSLEEAFAEHGELVARWFSRRLTIDRHKLEAANAAFWSGGAFLHIPPEAAIEDPFEIVYAIGHPGLAQYGRTLVVGGQTSEVRVHEDDPAEALQ